MRSTAPNATETCALAQIFSQSFSRSSASSFLESLSPRGIRSGSSTTAAATTGPASGPRPTSSQPATGQMPFLRARRSRLKVGRKTGSSSGSRGLGLDFCAIAAMSALRATQVNLNVRGCEQSEPENSLVRQLQASVVGQRKVRIVRHLPEMAVEIRKIAAIAAPERILRGLADHRPRLPCATDYDIDIVLRTAVPCQRDAAKIFGHTLGCDVGIVGEFIRWKNGNRTGAGLEKSYAVGRERLASKTQCFVESDAALEIGDAERHQREDSRRLFHGPNRLSCSVPGFGLRKCSVVNCFRAMLSPSFSHAISKRRPIIHA